MVGSSKTNTESDCLFPISLAGLSRCDSPPEREDEVLYVPAALALNFDVFGRVFILVQFIEISRLCGVFRIIFFGNGDGSRLFFRSDEL